MRAGMILTLNLGSSSVKGGLYARGLEPSQRARCQIDAFGPKVPLVIVQGEKREERLIAAPDHASALSAVMGALVACAGEEGIAAVGHRIVHGGAMIDGPRVLTGALLEELSALAPLAPLHQPHNLAGCRAAMAAFPDALQVGAFDTAFHRGHDWVNDTYALPRRFYAQGIRRYGFHGLSYASIAGQLARHHPDLAQGRVIVAHLGNGASLCAMTGGRSVASSMGFSALDGMPMGTRVGQLDPGVVLHLLAQGMDAEALSRLFYEESGLLGLSGISHDMRVLLASDRREAAEAIAYFTTRAARETGAMAAALGGVDAFVFTGGIGQHAAQIRAMVMEKLGFLGLMVDEAANAAHRAAIHQGLVPILVMQTDEEGVIAQAADKALVSKQGTSPKGAPCASS